MSLPAKGNRERVRAQGESDETKDLYINSGFYDASDRHGFDAIKRHSQEAFSVRDR